MLKLATVLTPLSTANLRMAAQCGVEGIVLRYPGTDLAVLNKSVAEIESYGLKVCAIEGYLPIEKIKIGQDHDGAEVASVHQLLRNMGQIDIPVLCYNFMAGSDWVRTQVDAVERGGAKVTAFRLADAQRAISLNARETDRSTRMSAPQLWDNLQKFLEQTIPVAESTGVTMCMHPDDPPLDEFLGKARIMNSVENFERLVRLVPSPRNAICFCLGTFATMELDVIDAIRRLGQHIQYVHFRDARGTRADFVETFHDNGPTDMPAVVRTLREVGFTGSMRPDHVPQMEGEDDGEPGYTMLGRLFAFGYMRGLLHATA
ncbi:MAG: mannonate dehydratase [Pirellulaceae bacterium]|nr:mannonate dehydratase [Pirellulaceae bacterium]